MNKQNLIIRAYSFFLAALPIIDIYKSPIPKISLGELILIIFSIIVIINIFQKPQKVVFGNEYIRTEPIIFFISILLLTLISLLFLNVYQYSSIDILNRFIRLMLWAVTISFTGYYLFNFEIAKKWIIRISSLGSIYIIIQSLFWYGIGISLPSLINISILSPVSIGYLEIERLNSYYQEFYYRPSSFFEEPESFSIYILLGIILLTLKDEKAHRIVNSKNHSVLLLLFSVGVILSTSTTGIYLMVLVFAYNLFKGKKVNKFKLRNVVLIPFVFLLGLGIILSSLIFTNSSNIDLILSKPFNFNDAARLGGSFNLFNGLESIQRFIGTGFGNEDYFLQLEGVYYNSITVILLSGGYIGALIFAIFALKTIFNINKNLLIIAFIYIVLCFTGSMLYSALGILYLTLSYYTYRKEDLRLIG